MPSTGSASMVVSRVTKATGERERPVLKVSSKRPVVEPMGPPPTRAVARTVARGTQAMSGAPTSVMATGLPAAD